MIQNSKIERRGLVTFRAKVEKGNKWQDFVSKSDKVTFNAL